MQDPGLPLLRGNADPTFFLLLCIVAIVGWELWQRRRLPSEEAAIPRPGLRGLEGGQLPLEARGARLGRDQAVL